MTQHVTDVNLGPDKEKLIREQLREDQLLLVSETFFYAVFDSLADFDTFLDLWCQSTGEYYVRQWTQKNFGERGNYRE